MTFAAMMRQECGWFDNEEHSSGALSARLTGDAGNLQSVCKALHFISFQNCSQFKRQFCMFQVIGFPLGVILQSISTFVIGIVVAFHYSYKLSLVCLAAVPLSLLTVLIEAKHMSKTAIVEKESTEMGTKIATEAITNIRTVASLSM